MNADQYQDQALRTESPAKDVGISINEEKLIRLFHAGLGLATEAGEFLDPIKKKLFYNKPIDYENMKEEISDCLWYCAIACDALGTTISELMEANIRKLRARYPDRFTGYDAVNRNLDKEMAAFRGEDDH